MANSTPTAKISSCTTAGQAKDILSSPIPLVEEVDIKSEANTVTTQSFGNGLVLYMGLGGVRNFASAILLHEQTTTLCL